MNACTRPHVLVTGASSGIGQVTALRMAAFGCHVYAGVRKPAHGPALAEAAAGELTPLLLDGADPLRSPPPPRPLPGTRATQALPAW